MVGHLFEKFHCELRKLLEWLLSFGNRLTEWKFTKPYEIAKLDKYDVNLSETSLLVVEVSIEAARSRKQDSRFNMNSGDEDNFETEKSERHPINRKVPFKTRLKNLKPKQAKHAIETTPMIEAIYFRLFKWVNFVCMQFGKVPRIERLLYKRIKFHKEKRFLQISPASAMRDAQVFYDEQGLPSKSEESPDPSGTATPMDVNSDLRYDEIY